MALLAAILASLNVAFFTLWLFGLMAAVLMACFIYWISERIINWLNRLRL